MRGCDDALGFLQVRGPFVEAFAEDGEDVAPAAGRGVAGEGFGAQPGCGGALDRERPEVEEHDGILGVIWAARLDVGRGVKRGL